MTNLPESFPQQPELAIASYDFADITTKTGYVNFYAADAIDAAGAASYFLTRNPALYGYSGSLKSGGGATILTYSLSITIQSPLDIEGIFHLNVPSGLITADVETVANVVIANVNKIVDSVTTILFSGSLQHAVAFNPASNEMRMLTFSDELPFMHLKKGDQLEIKFYNSKTGGGANAKAYVGADPANRSVVPFEPGITWDDGSRTTLAMPVKIRL